MINFIKKIFAFSKKKNIIINGLIKDDKINAITDEEAKEFLNKLPLESLIGLNLNINEIYL